MGFMAKAEGFPKKKLFDDGVIVLLVHLVDGLGVIGFDNFAFKFHGGCKFAAIDCEGIFFDDEIFDTLELSKFGR